MTAHLSYIGLEDKGVCSYDYLNPDMARPIASNVGSDGWTSPNAEITIPISENTHAFLLKLEYPGWAGIASHANLIIHDQDNHLIHTVLNQGSNAIIIPCKEGSRQTTLHLETDVSFLLPAPDSRRCSYRLVAITPSKLK